MGGGNTGGFIGGYGVKSDEVDCNEIDFECALFSPDSAVLQKITKGDILTIEYNAAKKSLMVFYGSKLAGTILDKMITRVINCIVEKNVEFIAMVKEINGGNCLIQVKAK